MAEQLGFDLPGVPALGRADFMVAPSNAMAVSLIENWQNWPDGKLLLCGPEGSGKTHLTHVWAAQSDAAVVAASDLATADIPALIQRPVAIEDVPDLAGNRVAQTALFHLHNLAIPPGLPTIFSKTGIPARRTGSSSPSASHISCLVASTTSRPCARTECTKQPNASVKIRIGRTWRN